MWNLVGYSLFQNQQWKYQNNVWNLLTIKTPDDVNGVVLVSILLTLNRCLMVENGVFCFNFERILYISQVSVLLLLLEGSSELANLFRFLIVIHDLPSIYGTQVELVHRPNPFHNRLQVYCCPHESFHRLKLLLRSKFSKKKMRTEK